MARRSRSSRRTPAHESVRSREHVVQAVIATDVHGDLRYWDAEAERLYGWTSAEVTGRNLLALLSAPGTRARRRRVLERLLEGEPFRGEIVVRHRDGTRFVATVVEWPLCDETGRVDGVVCVTWPAASVLPMADGDGHAERVAAEARDVAAESLRVTVDPRP